MNSGNESSKSMYETAPEPISEDAYEKLTPEQDEKMRELMARDTKMTKAEAYKIVMGSREEEK